MVRSGCMGRRRETLLWAVRGPAAALGPCPRALKVICMRTGPTQATRTPGGCVCEDLSQPGLLAHDLCQYVPSLDRPQLCALSMDSGGETCIRQLYSRAFWYV
jgi:hypothetical protein